MNQTVKPHDQNQRAHKQYDASDIMKITLACGITKMVCNQR
jgi:hypothetical protein